ncbi:hypothetical protein ACLMJK_003263 [Lecanora helva]
MLSTIALTALLVAGSNATPTKRSNGTSSTCKPGFLNTVFNTGSAAHASWPDPIWSTLTSYGIDNLITFTLLPINQNPNFDAPAGTPARDNAVIEAARIPIVMNPNDTNNAQALVASANAPPYLELFNEPDFSYGGVTGTVDPVAAAQNLSELLTMPHNKTKYISPALAFDQNWLPTFFQNCNNCLSQFDIISMHLYQPDVDSAISAITAMHTSYPDKKIWITEFGPYNGGPSGCTFDQAGVVNYAQTIVPKINALDYVEKIFWNCGDAEAADVCNPSLTNEDGSATDVLKGLGGACGFTGA